MKHMAIAHLGMVGLLAASVAGATVKSTATAPTTNSEEIQDETDIPVAETDGNDTAPSSEGEKEETGQIFDVHEREAISDPNFDVKKDKADEYFRRGTLLYEGGDYASAAQAFLVAYETLPHQAVLGNIALCFDKAGKIPDAVVYYREYLAKPVGSEKDEYMSSRLKELETLVGELELSCRVVPCEIRVDGIVRERALSSIVLMPGEHRIEAYSTGDLVESRLVDINTREKLTVTIDIKPEAPKKRIVVVPPPIVELPEVQQEERCLFGPFFWVASGATVVSAAVAATLGGLVLRKKSEFKEAEPDSKKQKDLSESGERLVLATNVMIGVTGVGAIASAILAYRDVKKKRKKEKDRPELKLTTSVSELGFGVAFSF